MKKIFISVVLVLFCISSVYAEKNVIVMGYKDKSKSPLINGKDDNSGLYEELFKNAAEKIGYTLKIVRLPKKRVHIGFKEGTIDFYPGASFSTKRASYLYYLPNGLKTKEVLVSKKDVKNITKMSDVKGSLLTELGSSKSDWDKKYPGLEIVKMTKLSMDKVVTLINKGRGDFYVADIEVIDYYKKMNSIANYESIGIKVHDKAINKAFVPMYVGFSRKSPLFKEEKNNTYDSTAEIAITNFPTKVSEDCIAYKFSVALDELKKEGSTQRFYDKYFK